MSKNTASAIWKGDLKGGTGKATLSSTGDSFGYTFASRFENGKGTNPEELIAAAHAACFSMALSNIIAGKGYKPIRVSTSATATLGNPGDGFLITDIELSTEGSVEGIDEKTFLELAEEAKAGCPVSKTLAPVNITLKAKLV
ncbi:MAG: OsmC family peroxiredoxin [Bacteroidales bacterium]|nr:OsmC family peroxiredoxin [Bacteroidales bacterium]